MGLDIKVNIHFLNIKQKLFTNDCLFELLDCIEVINVYLYDEGDMSDRFKCHSFQIFPFKFIVERNASRLLNHMYIKYLTNRSL